MGKKIRLTESQVKSVVTSRMLKHYGREPEQKVEEKKVIKESKQIDNKKSNPEIDRIKEIMGL